MSHAFTGVLDNSISQSTADKASVGDRKPSARVPATHISWNLTTLVFLPYMTRSPAFYLLDRRAFTGVCMLDSNTANCILQSQEHLLRCKTDRSMRMKARHRVCFFGQGWSWRRVESSPTDVRTTHDWLRRYASSIFRLSAAL